MNISIYALVEQKVLNSHCHSINTDKSCKFLSMDYYFFKVTTLELDFIKYSYST